MAELLLAVVPPVPRAYVAGTSALHRTFTPAGRSGCLAG